MTGPGPDRNARRVVIKSRYVTLKRAGAKSISTHLRYIEREGVTREGARGQAYGADADQVDLKSFEERGAGDRHQFRFIVSVEDAQQMEDLREFTRTLMRRMASDLESPLDWVAVDHWDTDNPHTHVVLRGKAGDGQDLVIAQSYMAHGMRYRAQEIATEWLGPRTALEIQEGLRREVAQDRLTGLDRQLLSHAKAHSIDLTAISSAGPSQLSRQALLGARLQHLEELGVAAKDGPGRWTLSPDLRSTLEYLSARGDIIRTMHRALQGEARELAIGAPLGTTITGRILAKGLADEIRDTGFLVVDGLDGRVHHVVLSASTDLADLPIGGIVETRTGVNSPGDGGRVSVALLCHLPIHQQIDAAGPTWLDQCLVQRREMLGTTGFAAIAREALSQRARRHLDSGIAKAMGTAGMYSPNLLRNLRDREMLTVGNELAAKLGKTLRIPQLAETIVGRLVAERRMASGRFGFIDDGASLAMVPWRASLSEGLGKPVSLAMGADHVIRRSPGR